MALKKRLVTSEWQRFPADWESKFLAALFHNLSRFAPKMKPRILNGWDVFRLFLLPSIAVWASFSFKYNI